MTLSPYKYGGAEALVALHARYLREFLATWRRADEAGLELPTSSSPSYASRETLLAHVLRAAAYYLTWTCEQLQLPQPDLDLKPDPAGLTARAEEYMEAVLAAWDVPLRGLTENVADQGTYRASWGTDYCIDAMLEHAVMHPIRHTHQLEKLLASR